MEPVFPVFIKLSGTFFTIHFLMFYLQREDIVGNLPFMVITGITLGGLFSLMQVALNRSEPKVEFPENEEILKKQLSVHGRPFKDAGGWLYLTSLNLHFKSHWMSSRKRELSIPITSINEAKNKGSKKLVITVNGTEEELFTLRAASKWSDLINKLIESA